MIFPLKKEKPDDSQINKMFGYSFFGVISGLFDDKNPFLLPYLHPRKLTNVPWKSMVGSDVFPIELVPWKRGQIVSFSGRVDHLVGISSQHHGKTYQILVSTKVRHHQSTKGSLQKNGWLTHSTGSRGIFFGDFWGSWMKRCRFVILRVFLPNRKKQLELIWFQGLVLWHLLQNLVVFFLQQFLTFKGIWRKKHQSLMVAAVLKYSAWSWVWGFAWLVLLNVIEIARCIHCVV